MADVSDGETFHEQLRGGPTAPRMVELAERDLAFVEDIIRGEAVSDASRKHGMSIRQGSRVLKDYASSVRAEVQDKIAQAFAMQEARLERLYQLVEFELQAYEKYMRACRAMQDAGATLTPVKFDDRPFRVAVLIFDRQARLLGFDRGGIADKKGPGGWLDGAPIGEVVAYAKQLKMNLPTEFET